ncbi:ROK family transcriptional regulator [Streptomyces roseolus]|uniref:ROK family transcriptional regulator n=1 Tax=Streptomyces roseolus TaxID=67358 RepID=UPI001675BD21|nr:ROK family transcriptional regulator [Streptomyces roseolus]
MRRDPGGGANLTALRGHNAALVLDLLRTAGEEGISRLELAARTGLTPQAVSKITARLRADGLAAEAGRRASTGGKPRTVLRLVPGAAHAIGVHLDRDEVTVALTDLTGTPLAVRRHAVTLSDGPPRVLETLVRAVRALLAEPAPPPVPRTASPRPPVPSPAVAPPRPSGPVGAYGPVAAPGPVGAPEPVEAPGPVGTPVGLRLLGVGVAMPGPLEHRGGVAGRVTGAPGWDGFPVREALEARLGVPVVLDKDTNAAALDLAVRPGAPRSFAYVHLGTGLGAGLVVGGLPLRGERTGAGELGHQTVQLDGPRCDCGARGCLEALCLAAVARGELPEAARILGAGAANLVRLLDIDRVLLGGRVVLAAPEVFADGVAAVLADRRLPTPVEVTATPHAVARGAAQLVLAPVFGQAPSVHPPMYSSEERTIR